MRAPVGVASSIVSVGRKGPYKGLSWRGTICTGSFMGVPTGEGEDVIASR